MPSLVQTGEFAGSGYPLVNGGSAIVALGAGGVGANVILDETSDPVLDEGGNQVLDET